MKRMINNAFISGYVFSHKFKKSTSKNGMEFYGGTMSVATKIENGQPASVVTVRFPYVPKTNKNNSQNKTFQLIDRLVTLEETIQKQGITDDGKTMAMKVSINGGSQDFTNLKLVKNEYFSRNQETGEMELKGNLRLEARNFFEANKLPESDQERNSFSVDAFITEAKQVEGETDEDPSYVLLHCIIFDDMKVGEGYGTGCYVVDFPVYGVGGQNYFLSKNISAKSPMFTRLLGTIKVTVEEGEVVIDESDDNNMGAFGDAQEVPVKPTVKSFSEFEIINARKEPYNIGDEAVLTVDEVSKLISEMKLRHEQLKAEAEQREQEKAQETMGAFNSADTSGFASIDGGVFDELPFDSITGGVFDESPFDIK